MSDCKDGFMTGDSEICFITIYGQPPKWQSAKHVNQKPYFINMSLLHKWAVTFEL